MKKIPLFLFLLLVVLLMSLLLAACSDQDDAQEKTVWDDQLKTMDKARQAEQIILDSAERQRQQIEEETH